MVKHAPTVILRPIIGTSRAVGTALLGVGNQIDRGHLRKIDDVSDPSTIILSNYANLNRRNIRDAEKEDFPPANDIMVALALTVTLALTV